MRALAGEHEFSAQGYKDTTWHAITLGSILSGIRILTPGGLKEGSVDMMSKEGWVNIRNLMFNRKPIGKQVDLNTEKLPYNDNTFDYVICLAVIEHISNATFFFV